jgi:zinc transport system substrate-binding protein
MRYLSMILFVAVMFGCNQPAEKSSKATITVSILPQKYIVEQIAVDNFSINVLVPDGSGPETYEPTAQQMQEISKSVACFTVGLLDFEKSWLHKANEMYPNLKVVNTSVGLDLLSGHAEFDHDHGHYHSGIDPHTWLSLKEVKKQSDIIRDQIIALDPDNKATYTTNHQKFITRLDSLDSNIASKLSGVENPSFMIYHPSLSYYARDYNVEQISIEFEGKEPSPSYMKELIDLARSKNVETIFYSEQFDKRSAQTIANQLGITMSGFNPLMENIEENLLNITEQIIKSNAK